MAGDAPNPRDLQAQIDALSSQVKAARVTIDALERRADASDARADASDVRADASDVRADAIEARAVVDRDMIAELQRDGVLSREHAAQMEEALKSSRTIGAAIGLIMGSRHLSEQEAFEVLRTASVHSNRKLRELAAELVAASAA